MRAKEFVINVPINIKIDGDGTPDLGEIDEPQSDPSAQSIPVTKKLPPKPENKLDLQPMMVPPLQQELELKKAAIGKSSPVIQKLAQDEVEAPESEPINRFNR